MRAFSGNDNIDAPSADYPKGRSRDKVGATPGTTSNERLNGDMQQLFQKLVIDAQISENGLPDNVSNGYQLLEALLKKHAQGIELRGDVAPFDFTKANLTYDNTWRDLDISTIIPAVTTEVPVKYSKVILKIHANSLSASDAIMFRKKGHTNNYSGINNFSDSLSDLYFETEIEMDTSFVIQYNVNLQAAPGDVKISVVGWRL